MKNTKHNLTDSSYVDERPKLNPFYDSNSNYNYAPKNLKIEEMNNINFAAGIPVNFEELNSMIDYNSINPQILQNKLVRMYFI